MQKYLDANDAIGSIRLCINNPTTDKNTIWVLVEGNDDVKIFSNLLNCNCVSVETIPGGVSKLEFALSDLEKVTSRVLGIRDADFIHLNNYQVSLKSLFVTDCHDIEMQMVFSKKTMRSLFCEHQIDHSLSDNIINDILEAVKFIGAIRWYNDTYDLELSFKDLPLVSFFNPDELAIDKEAVISIINSRSSNKKREITLQDIEDFMPSKVDLYNLCNGHDFVKALALFVSQTQKPQVSDKDIQKALRLSYDIEAFKTSRLYNSLVDWEKRTSYRLFQN